MSDEHHEIVIVKRHHGDHDDHHGGAWKIAFADFMTAMMAFFLVMWLIAAATPKTKSSIAHYFNPVKLVDATIRPPGIHDAREEDASTPKSHDMDVTGRAKDVGHKEPVGPPPSESPKGREVRLDSTLRTNPFVALAEIVGTQGASDVPPKDAPRSSAPVIGREGGTAFRDPFAPPPPQSPDLDEKDEDPLGIAAPPPRVPDPGMSKDKDAEKPTPASPVAKSQGTVDSAKTPAGADAAKLEKKDQDLAKQLLASVKTAGHESEGPDLKVRRTSEGFLISLTDTSDFSMFANGSAVPGRKVVLMMESVAKILATKPGGIVIRGYTDNKPFRTGHYDNWNLSVDRAQTAHYMLVRGGLPDTRIASVEGFADRATAPGQDPSSPLNRRIEILLKDEGK
jgi:chemotaxis protein MotB